MRLKEKPKIVLYCLPFAGGNVLSYRDLQANLVDAIQIKALDLPGHGKRIRETLLTHLEALIDDIYSQIRPEIDGQPYAIYGHSMGASLAHLLIKRFVDQNLSKPVHLFISGRKAPSVSQDKILKHQLPKKAFLAMLKELGGFPLELLEHTEMMDLLEPVLRADFQALETFVYHQTQPFDIPITILHGLADQETTYSDLLPWQQETTHPILIKQFAGSHFFIFEHLEIIGQLFSQTLMKTVKTVNF